MLLFINIVIWEVYEVIIRVLVEIKKIRIIYIFLGGWVEYKSYLEIVKWLVGVGSCDIVNYLIWIRDG